MKSKNKTKRIKKTISLLTLICLLAGSFTTAQAGSLSTGEKPEDNTGENQQDTSGNRVVFDNEEDPVPVLYVTKTLDSEGKKTPEGANPETDVFTFTLLVQKAENGLWEEVTGKEYTVTDSENKTVTRPVDGGGQSSFFELGAGSTFTLCAGETAKFGFLKNGWKYKVEEKGKDLYTLKSIKIDGDDVYGKIAEEKMSNAPERVEMINGYKVGDGKLKVSKELVFAPGYTPPQSPVFEFQLTFPEQQAQRQYVYTLYRKTATGYLDKLEEGLKTDMSGKFTLLGGQMAEFQDLPEDAVYELKELGLANVPENADRKIEGGDWQNGKWWLFAEDGKYWLAGEDGKWQLFGKDGKCLLDGESGPEERTGKTNEAGEETFKNSNTSFAVSKRLSDYTELPETKPEDMSDEDYEKERQKMTFTFYLTDGSKGIKARYYLYYNKDSKNDKRGTRVDQIIHETAEDGSFTLPAGQTAVFIGMKPGSYYKVREAVALNSFYSQVTPEDEGGYSVRKVEDSPKVLEFVNGPVPTGLRVTKDLVNYKGEEPPDRNMDFTFILEKKEGEEFVPVGGAVYTIGEESLQTKNGDSDKGQFTLKAYQEAMFTQLDRGAVYRVGELVSKDGSPVGDSSGYNVSEYEFGYWQTTDAEGNSNRSGEGVTAIDYSSGGNLKVYYTGELTLIARKNISFAFANNYVPDKLDLELLKVDFNEKVLAGAEFTLYRGETASTNNVVTNPETGTDRFVTGADGIVTIHDLNAGDYVLQEVKAPSGYALLGSPIPIKIVRKGSQIEVVVDGKTVRGEKLQAGEPVTTGVEEIPNVQVTLNQNGNDQVKLTVYNAELYELPSSGGMGIYWYSIGGMLLMMAASLILYRNKHRGEVLKD